ncbi:MAG: DnaJ domain-containing protein [Alphaproteobacteria bacterium]
MQTHYDVLGVGIKASAEEIKQAYRRLARQHHPDAPQGSTERFQALGHAYETLNHPEKRRLYDEGLNPKAKPKAPPKAKPAPKEESSLWASFSWKKESPPPPDPKHLDVPISARQCQEGGKITVVWKEGKALKISVPKGARHGDLLKMSTSDGPVVARVVVTEDTLTTQGADVHAMLPLALGEAITGTRITITTPQGDVSLKIPPHTSSHRMFRLKGKGLRQAGGTVGDYVITIQIILPTHLDPALMAFAAQWQNQHPYTVRPAG